MIFFEIKYTNWYILKYFTKEVFYAYSDNQNHQRCIDG
jgi:hypothetical protein